MIQYWSEQWSHTYTRTWACLKKVDRSRLQESDCLGSNPGSMDFHTKCLTAQNTQVLSSENRDWINSLIPHQRDDVQWAVLMKSLVREES